MPSAPPKPFTPPKRRRSSGSNPLSSTPNPPKGNPLVKPATKPTVKSPIGSRGVQKRSQNRLSRIVSRGGKAPEGVKPGRKVTLQQAHAIKDALLALNAANRAKDGSAKPAAFDPLAPLTGKNFEDELGAATREQFGEQDRGIAKAYQTNQEGQEITGSYFDQYQKALAEATGRMKQANDDSIKASEGRVDTAFKEDSAAADARSTEASRRATALGLSGTQGTEGARAAEAARSQGNQAITEQRTQAGSSNTLMEGRGATAVQAKAENLARAQQRREGIREDERGIARAKGDFATNFRNKARESERSWAAVQSEFGLKEKELASKEVGAAADRRIEAQKNATQKIVAKLYADAGKEKAKATIRVAKLQLEKGKIDQKQYNEIVNIYKGLPAKGKPTPAKPAAPREGTGSGPNGTMAPWETDASDRAKTGFTKNKYTSKDRSRAIAKAVEAGIPRRIAVQAWNEYIGHVKTPYDNRTRG